MNAFSSWISMPSDDLSAATLFLLAKLTVFLAFAWSCHAILQWANPRWRILLWRFAGGGAIGLAMLSFMPPLLQVPVRVATGMGVEVTARPDGMDLERLRLPLRREAIAKAPVQVAAEPAVKPSTLATKTPPPAVTSPKTKAPNTGVSWIKWMLVVWGASVACGALRMLVGLWRAAAIRDSSLAVPDWVETAASAAGSGVEVRQSTAIMTPCSIGISRKAILLPATLCVEGRSDDVRAAVAHEAAHFRGGDLAWNLLLHVTTVLLWFHPLAWRMRLAHADACDERCDAEAAALVGDARLYGQALARLALDAMGWTPTAVLAMARRKGVSRRMDLLFRRALSPRLRPGSAAAVLFVATILFFLGGATSLAPTQAQEAKQPPDGASQPAETPPVAVESHASTATKAVRVVDPNGKPVAGATVVPWAIRSRAGHGPWSPEGQGGSEPPTLTTDADGVAHVPIPEYAIRDEKLPPDALTCRVEHPDFAESVYNDVPVRGELRDEVATITIRPGALVEIVATENDKQLSAENVYALASSPSGGPGQSLSPAADGALRLPRLPAGGELIRLVRLSENGRSSFSDVQRLDLEDGGTLQLEVALRPGVDVIGRLADDVPRPIINGRVVAEVIDLGAGDGRESLSWRTWARINADGTFRLTALPPGELQLIALCDGYMAASGQPPAFANANERQMASSFSRPQVFTVGGGEASVVLAMMPTAEAVVRTLDTRGQPVTGAEIHFWPNVGWWGGGSQVYVHPLYDTADVLKQGKFDWGDMRKEPSFSATTGADGVAVISNLPPGRERFTVLHERLEMAAGDNPGLRSKSIELVGGRRSETTVILHPKGTQPLPEPGDVPVQRGRDATVLPKPRPPRSFQTEAGETELAGVVTDEAGKPLAGVNVDAWTWFRGNETTTDDAGRFLLKGFDANEAVEVEFSKADYSPSLFVAQQPGTDDWTVVLTQGTWLEGTVIDPDGRPVPGALIRAVRGPFRQPTGTISEVWSETKARGDGKYRLHLESGTYDVQVRQPGVGVIRREKVTLAEKEKKPLDLRLEEGVTLRAHVLDSVTNEPVEGIVFWKRAEPGIEGTSDANGVLEIKGMMEGEFEFNVTAVGENRRRSSIAGQYARWWSPMAVHQHQREEPGGNRFRRNFDGLTFRLAGDEVEVTVFVEASVTLRGRVLDPEGKPVAGATVAPARTGSGNSLTGDTRFSYKTDADGRFEMKLPASGDAEYNLIAHDGKYSEWRTWANGVGDPFQTMPGQQVEDVELVLNRPATVRGQVTDSQGRPRRNVEVRAASTEKRDNRYYVPTTRTDADGKYELRFVGPGKHYVQVAPFWLEADQAPHGTTQVIEVIEGGTVEDADFATD